RRSADPDSNESGQDLRDRRSRDDAEGGERGYVPVASAEDRRDFGDRAWRLEGDDPGGGDHAGAGGGDGRSGARRAAGVRDEIVRRDYRARDRSGGWFSDRRDARAEHRREREVFQSVADIEGAFSAERSGPARRRYFPAAGSGAHAEIHGGGG